MSKKDLKAVCRVLGREVPKTASAKDLRSWLLENSGASRRTTRKTHASAKAAQPPAGVGGGWEDAGSGLEDLEEKAPSPTEASRDQVGIGAFAVRRGGGGATGGRGKTQGKVNKAEAETEPPDSSSTSAERPDNGGGDELRASAERRGHPGGSRKLFGWRARGKAIKRLELVLENLGESNSKDQRSEDGEQPRTFLKAPDSMSPPPRERPEASSRRSTQSGLNGEYLRVSPEEEARDGVPRTLTWTTSQEKANRSFMYGPELFWRQLRRLRPRPREPYTDFAAQVTGLVGAWVEKAGAMTREEVIELIRLEHVVDQLPEQLCQLVLAQQPKTAMEAAALADQISFQRGRHLGLGPGPGPGIWPWFSQVQASPTGKGPKKTTLKSHTNVREATSKKEFQSSGAGWGWKPTPVRTCHKCGKVGHTRSNCPNWNSVDS
ncbi:uncharacterized protein [Notamacropus eugenii]|uniref:uncharacterized protein n=1 Tax=Notamacropus eugenii TaxID=9315 RepID=UPI003B682A96